MISKKGIVVTAVALTAITAASFLVWIIPQGGTVTISDYGAYLDRVQQIDFAVTEELATKFEMLESGELDPSSYVNTAEASSAQLRSELIEMMQLNVPNQWAQSYQLQADAVKLSVGYIRETIAAAEKIGSGDDASQIIIKAGDLRNRSDDAAAHASTVRPDA